MFTRKEKNMLYDPYFEVIRETEQFIEVRSANTGHCWSVFKNIYNAPRKITLYSGDVDRNTEKARRYCRFAVDQGAIPLAAHMLLPQFMSETKERDLALFMDMVLMGKCEQVWVFGEKISSGMAAEIAKAKKRNMRIRYFTEECKEIS